MVKEIIAQNGLVDKFIGDCIMAVFRGNYHRPGHRCLLAVKKKIAELPPEPERLHPKCPSGYQFRGNDQWQYRFRQPAGLDFTVIGDVVDTALGFIRPPKRTRSFQ